MTEELNIVFGRGLPFLSALLINFTFNISHHHLGQHINISNHKIKDKDWLKRVRN